MKRKIVIIGCGGHAKSVIEVIESVQSWEIKGLVGFKEELNKKILGYKVIGTDQDLKRIRNDCPNAFIAVGQIKSSERRLKISNQLTNLGFSLPTIIASSAIVSNSAIIKKGTLICHGAIINANAKIGVNCIINTKSLIEHDVEIGDFCHISTGTLINGGVKIGDNSFVGSGAIIREGIIIPPATILGAGQKILHWPFRDNKI